VDAEILIRKLYRLRRSLDGLANDIIAALTRLILRASLKRYRAPFTEVKLLELAISKVDWTPWPASIVKQSRDFAQRMGQADQTTRGLVIVQDGRHADVSA